jgi:penicillin-binding protein 1A
MEKANKNIYQKLIKTLWISFISFLVGISLFIYLVSIDFLGLFGKMPSLEVLENPKSEVASELYTEDNVILGKYFRENRTLVQFENLSPNLINALVATEDYRFESHSGIDIFSLMRVFFKTFLLRQSNAGGGSTLSQQLAKNLFETRSESYSGTLNAVPLVRTLIVKAKEWITSIKIERSYTKQEILTMYLNTVDFGSNSFGIKVASKTFFNTTPDSLSIIQSAVLVGVLKAPSYYSPVYNPENSKNRRNTVLSQMLKFGYLNQEQHDTLANKELVLNYSLENHNSGFATYFRSVITNYLTAWCKERGMDLYADGLRIYTTIDSRMQTYAEQAMEQHMKDEQKKFGNHWKNRMPWTDQSGKTIPNFIENAAKKTDRWRSLKANYGDDTAKIWKIFKKPIPMKIFSWKGEIDTIISPYDSIKWYKKFLHAGFMSMNPQNGHIKAWVGGINHKHFKYDHVKQGRRQPGSTFKPFVYCAAIDMGGYTPCFEIPDLPVTFETGDENKTWTPENFEGEYTGEIYTLRKAMANSINSITANLVKKVGPKTVVDLAKRMGISSPLEPVPAICLGVFDVSLYEMVAAYCTFVNKGFWNQPIYITRIEDKDGNLLQEFNTKSTEVFTEETAYLMVHMLKGATEEKGGTALGLNRFGLLWQGYEIGGKTGTTQNYSDGWFIGITPRLVSGVWVGGDDRSIHFRSIEGQGSKMAMPIWALYMQKVFADSTLGFTKEAFPRPANLKTEINCKKYKENKHLGDSTMVQPRTNSIPDEF